MDHKYDKIKKIGSEQKKLKYLIFPWGNSAKVFHDVLEKRPDQWEELNYEKVTANHPRTWEANFVWKVRSQGMSGYQHVEGPPPKGYGLEEGEQIQVLNFMPHFRKVMTKVGLADAAKRYMKATQTSWPSFLPISVVILPFWQNLGTDGNHPLKSSQFQQFLDIHRQCSKGEAQHMQHHCNKNMWLIKPAAANRGIGIEIFSKVSEVKQFLRDKERWKEHWIIQKYIERPLLIEKRKFDIRAWMLLTTSKDGSKAIEAYIYDEWYVRLSSENYQTESFDRYIHLTNWSVQKKHSNFGAHEDGNTWTMKQFQNYLSTIENVNFDDVKFKIEEIMKTMCDMVFTCKANERKHVGSSINDNRRDNFEILGFDFMVDEMGAVWMLEINGNPSLSYQNKDHENLVQTMIGDLINLTTSRAQNVNKKKNDRSDNRFKLIFNSKRDFDGFEEDEVKTSSGKKKALPALVPQHRFVEVPNAIPTRLASGNEAFKGRKQNSFCHTTNSSTGTYEKWNESNSKETNKTAAKKLSRSIGGDCLTSRGKKLNLKTGTKKRLYKMKKNHPSIIERSVREAKLRFVERQLLEAKMVDDPLSLNVERGHVIPYVCSPIFVPPSITEAKYKNGKFLRNGIGRRNGFVHTGSEKVHPVNYYQMQRKRRPFLQFFETAGIRKFLKTKQIPKPIVENKWFKTLKAKQTLSLPRPWSQHVIAASRVKIPYEKDLKLEPGHGVQYRVSLL
jgi:hypothetical protein